MINIFDISSIFGLLFLAIGLIIFYKGDNKFSRIGKLLMTSGMILTFISIFLSNTNTVSDIFNNLLLHIFLLILTLIILYFPCGKLFLSNENIIVVMKNNIESVKVIYPSYDPNPKTLRLNVFLFFIISLIISFSILSAFYNQMLLGYVLLALMNMLEFIQFIFTFIFGIFSLKGINREFNTYANILSYLGLFISFISFFILRFFKNRKKYYRYIFLSGFVLFFVGLLINILMVS